VSPLTDALGGRVQRIAQRPVAREEGGVVPACGLGLAEIGSVDALDHVEEEQEAELSCSALERGSG